MKYTILLPLVTTALFSSIVEKSDGTYLEIFSKKTAQSALVATVSTHRGQLSQKLCIRTRDNGDWCKVKYTNADVSVEGYADKKSLDKINNTPRKRETFETSFGGDSDDVGNSILPLKDGALIVGYTGSFGAGRDDAYVIKVDKYGNKVSSSAFGGANDEVLKAVVEVENGFMAVGTTRSFGNSLERIYLVKLSKDGIFKWHNTYYSDRDDYYRGNDIIRPSKDKVIVVGSEDHVKFFASNKYIYLNSMDMNGNRIGIKRYGGEDTESGSSIVSTKDGYVIAGVTDTWGNGDDDMYVIKLNKDGDKVWHYTYGYKYDEHANKIITTQDGGYILVGTTESDLQNQKDVYVVKIDANGKLEWQRHYGTKENEEGYSIVETKNGYVIAGYTNYTPNYNSDVYILKIDKTGNVIWNKRYGGERDDKAFAIAKVNGGFMLTGYTTSPATYSKDVYVLKVDENGNIK